MEHKQQQRTEDKRNLPVSVSSIISHCLIVTLLVCSPRIINGADRFKDGVLVTDSRFYLQQGRSQRISCTSLNDTSDVVVVFWYKLPQVPDGDFEPDLLVRFTLDLHGGNYSAGPRYQLAPDMSLIIKSVVGEDAGRYQCQKVSSTQADNRENEVEVVVLDEEFPAARGVVREGRNITIKRNQQEFEISCPIEEVSNLRQPTVYWSTETSGLDEPTEIVAQMFSDEETYTTNDYRFASSNNLILPAVNSENSVGLWCHVSSSLDHLFLQSARVSVNIQDESYVGLIVGVLVAVTVVLIILVFLVCWKRDRVKRTFFKEDVHLQGPSISSGNQDEWTLETYLGPKGNNFGGKFSSLKSVASFNKSFLAVLDDNGLHTFSPDLTRLDHVTKLKASPENYVTMVTHTDGLLLLLGAKNGDVTSVSFKPFSEKLFCSLSEEKTDPDEKNEDSDSIKEPKGTSSESAALTMVSHELTDLAVDANGDVYAGDNSNHTVTIFTPGQKGCSKRSFELDFPPKILAGGSEGEIFAHNGDHGSPIKRIKVNDKNVETVFLDVKNSPVNPVNVLVDNSHVFIVSDTKVNGQMEILQYDNKGNFLRPFVKPWLGIQGMCMFASGERLALFDHSIVRIYRKQLAKNRVV
ncbi:uncharacterized protein LOC119736606 isoform X2 [Patiria miniata]|uniref:Ig-like domain-containing protein n=1 Tax=Patiria miniata TaxID=46514 RepID=A0A914AS96_PATMI|nr:uncharacterized protein LOC119736606 isoform X2 [Patiria miniata]